MAKSKAAGTPTGGYDVVRSGVDPRKDGKNGQWLKLESNQYVDAAILVDADDILVTDQCAIWLDDGNSPVWVYTGPDDPYHDFVGVEKRYRAYLPLIITSAEGQGEVRVWSMGKQAHGQLLDMVDAGAELQGMEIRIKRTGSNINTRYSIVQRGKRVDTSKIPEVDVLGMLGPLTSEGAREHLATKLNMPYEEIVRRYKGRKITKTALKKDGPASVDKAIENDEDELDDLELA